MKNILILLIVFLTACVPTAARPPIQYVATKVQIQDAIISYTQNTSISDFYNGWRIINIGDSSIVFQASTTTAATILLGDQTTTLVVTFTARESTTLVAVSATTGRSPNTTIEDRVIGFLDSKFTRAP